MRRRSRSRREPSPVDRAMAGTPRAHFLPESARPFAGYDGALTIGHGATCSQPRTVRAMLQLLDVRPGMRVLDVGSGSGWTTAILARLVGEGGRVLGVEIVPELVERSRVALAGEDVPWAEIRAADPDVLGLPDEAHFDRILVSAASDRMPTALVDQLGVGGVMVVPVGERLHRVTRHEDGWRAEAAPGMYAFVPLR